MADNQFNVFGQLIIIGKDLQTGLNYVVSLSPTDLELPTCEWATKAEDEIKHLVDTYIDLDIAWINPILVGVINKDERALSVVFAGNIPLDTPLQNAYWISTNEVTDVNITPILLEAVRKL